MLRRPPLGHVLATAHDMAREYRVISALRDTSVPVPATLALCTDPDVLGAPFYVMQRSTGVAYRTADQLGRARRRRGPGSSRAAWSTRSRAARGRPGRGRAGRLRPAGGLPGAAGAPLAASSSTRPAAARLPGIDELHERLAADTPDRAPPAIVHGDYRLDNVIFGPDDRVAAVVDWEMATLGDPLDRRRAARRLPAARRLGEGPMAQRRARLPDRARRWSPATPRSRARPDRPRLVHRLRLLQARGDLRGHPLPLPPRPDRRRGLRADRSSRWSCRLALALT